MAETNKATIDQAVDKAIVSVGSYNTALEANERDRMQWYETLQDRPDEYMVEGMFEGEASEQSVGSVEVETPDELMLAIQSLCSQSGFMVPQRRIALDVEHEKQHAHVLRKLGVRGVRYGFTLVQAKDTLAYFPYSRGVGGSEFGVTKLGFAAVVAAPHMPSRGDLQVIHAMGYGGLADVGMRIYQANSLANSNMFPLPGSFSMAFSPSGEEVPFISVNEALLEP